MFAVASVRMTTIVQVMDVTVMVFATVAEDFYITITAMIGTAVIAVLAHQMLCAIVFLLKTQLYKSHIKRYIVYFFYLRIKIESLKIRNIIYIIIMLFLFLWYLP